MKIYAHSVYREVDVAKRVGFLDEVLRLARLDAIGRHTIVETPEEADVVLITEAQTHLDDWRFSKIRNSSLVRRWIEKTYVYCDADLPFCILPGLYPSVPRTWQDASKQESFPYIGLLVPEIQQQVEDDSRDLLFSFCGQLKNHPCRRAMSALRHTRAEITDTSRNYHFALPPEQQSAARAHYSRQLRRSQFVLCPRGVGASSYRLFEAISAACVPVIISDDWVEPKGPQWSSFTVRVPENRVRSIPEFLAEREQDIATMRANCRDAFARFFCDQTLFNYLGDRLEHLVEVRGNARLSSAPRRWRAYSTVAGLHFWRAAKAKLKAFALSGRRRPTKVSVANSRS